MVNHNCPLCERESITKCYYEDEKIWIIDCDTCKIPMVVWKEHINKINSDKLSYIILMINRVFPRNKFQIDMNMRMIKDHFHLHLRNFE